jgi:hypothetical protein
MSVDAVKPTLNVQAVHPKQDGGGQAGRDSPRDEKRRQAEPPPQDSPPLFLNSLGQVTGKTINVTA